MTSGRKSIETFCQDNNLIYHWKSMMPLAFGHICDIKTHSIEQHKEICTVAKRLQNISVFSAYVNDPADFHGSVILQDATEGQLSDKADNAWMQVYRLCEKGKECKTKFNMKDRAACNYTRRLCVYMLVSRIEEAAWEPVGTFMSIITNYNQRLNRNKTARAYLEPLIHDDVESIWRDISEVHEQAHTYCLESGMTEKHLKKR